MILPNVSESWPGARVPLANYELPHVPAHGRGHGFPLGPALEVATQAARALARSGTSLHERLFATFCTSPFGSTMRVPPEQGQWNGRYWARTSDPQLVELVLSQLS
jgi:hypothetical protein